MSAAATDTEGFWRNATHDTPATIATVASATTATAFFTV
jgi:hypothetical protein